MKEKKELEKKLKEFYDFYLLSDLFNEMDTETKFRISEGHRAIKKALLMYGAKE